MWNLKSKLRRQGAPLTVDHVIFTHILTQCPSYSSLRERIKAEYEIKCYQATPQLDFQDILSDNETFCQFILDPTSFNLKSRIHINDPIQSELLQISRDFCYAVYAARNVILKTKS